IEFERTVKYAAELATDNFMVCRFSILFLSWICFGRSISFTDILKTKLQRPVKWILWSEVTQTAVIIIPEEAELLISLLRSMKQPSPTRLLVYSAPTTRKMFDFNMLTFYSIPTAPQDWTAPS